MYDTLLNILSEVFITPEQIPEHAVKGEYVPYLVAISYVIASMGAYIGIRIASTIVNTTDKKKRNFLHICGAIAFGNGIWSMHFIGMLAYKMDMVHSYEPVVTALSLVIATIIAYVFLGVLRSKTLTVFRTVGASLLLGMAICCMHYSGMAAMTMDAALLYKSNLFLLSVAIAIAASGAAILIVSQILEQQKKGKGRHIYHIAAALIMGVAVCGMHYTGMEAAVFIPFADCRFDPNQEFDILALAVGITSLLTFSIAMIFSMTSTEDKRKYQLGDKFYSGNKVFIQVSSILSLFLIMIFVSFSYIKVNLKHEKALIDLMTMMNAQRAHISTALEMLVLADQQPETHIHERMEFTNFHTQVKAIDNVYQSIKENDGIFHHRNIQPHTQGFDDLQLKINKTTLHWDSFYIATQSLQKQSALEHQREESIAEIKKLGFTALHEQDTTLAAVVTVLNNGIHDVMVPLKFVGFFSIVIFLGGLLFQKFFISKRIDQAHEKIQNQKETLEHRVEEQTRDLRAEKKHAERANRAKDDFLANMSHELRTPLNSIIGISNLMLEDDLKVEQLRNVETISKASGALLTMVNDVLDIAKIESGTFVLEPETFLINDMLAETFVQMQPLATKKGLDLKVYNAVPDDQALFGDAFRLSRTIINIVTNAIKYTHKGFVEVTTKLEPIDEKNMMFTCRVKDTGIGMSEYMMTHVFDKFTQANETSTREFQGTGLGLHITKNILDLMKGKISVDSAVDVGSVFEIQIPLPISEKPAQQSNDTDHRKLLNPALDTKSLGIPFSQASILIAEDHEMNRTLIKKLLSKWDNDNFHFVENGQECLEELERNPNTYDIIFMDCHMPIMDGWEASTRIRDDYDEHIPVIALTADAMPHTKATCFSKGMNAYISKPIHMATLKKILEEWFTFEDTNKTDAQDDDTDTRDETPPIVDLTTLREYVGDNEDDLSELLGVFYSSFSADLKNLTKETTEGTNEAWSEIAHKLKGSAAQVGAQNLRELCAEAQTMIKATEEERKKLLADIEGSFDDVCKDLDRQNYKYVSG